MTNRTINEPPMPVVDRLRKRWAEHALTQPASSDQYTIFYVSGADLLDTIATLAAQARTIKHLEDELSAMRKVEPHGEPEAYVITNDVRLVRHGSEYGVAGKWDVLLTRNFDTDFERVRTYWPVSYRPLCHDMKSWTAVIDDFGNLVPVVDDELDD